MVIVVIGVPGEERSDKFAMTRAIPPRRLNWFPLSPRLVDAFGPLGQSKCRAYPRIWTCCRVYD